MLCHHQFGLDLTECHLLVFGREDLSENCLKEQKDAVCLPVRFQCAHRMSGEFVVVCVRVKHVNMLSS